MATFPKHTNPSTPPALEQNGIPAPGPTVSFPASQPGYLPWGPDLEPGPHGAEQPAYSGPEHAQWYEQGLNEQGGGPYTGAALKNPAAFSGPVAPQRYTPGGAGSQDAR